MDNLKQELDELCSYSNKLLDEIRHQDIIATLQELISHIANIANEYSKEAEQWHNKYVECAEQNENLQNKITDLTEANKQQNENLRNIIAEQAETIKEMRRNFEQKLDELRSHRDKEIDNYNRKVQELITANTTLKTIRDEFETAKRQLEEATERCNNEKANYEEKRIECERQIEVNKSKLDGYDELFNYKMNAESKLAEVQKAATAKENEGINNYIKSISEPLYTKDDMIERLEKVKEEMHDMLESDVVQGDHWCALIKNKAHLFISVVEKNIDELKGNNK